MGKSWLVIDSLYCPQQFFASHLDSYAHYLREAGETVWRCCLSGFPEIELLDEGRGGASLERAFYWQEYDVAFFLDGYARALEVRAEKRIAQIACVTSPMPWEVRKADGSPAYDLVISSIPAMVDAARTVGVRAEYQPLCADARTAVCGMGTAERDIPCLFVGTLDANHRKRAMVLNALGDTVTVAPPTFGRAYYELLSRARVLIHVGAEWSGGARNALRFYEGAMMGALVVGDGDNAPGFVNIGIRADTPEEFAIAIQVAADRPDWLAFRADEYRSAVRGYHTYVERIPQLIEWATEL